MHIATAPAEHAAGELSPHTRAVARWLTRLLTLLTVLAAVTSSSVALAAQGSIELRVLSQPGTIFSEEASTEGIRVQAWAVNSNGQLQPLPNLAIEAFVSSGSGRFSNGTASTQVITNSLGEATTPAIVAARDARPIVVSLFSDAAGSVPVTIGVQPSRYFMDALPAMMTLAPGEPAQLVGQLRRQGSGAVVPVIDALVNWSASGGGLLSTRSASDAEGLARNRFQADEPGNYTIEANAALGPGLPTLNARFEVRVAPDGSNPQLQIGSGDGQVGLPGTRAEDLVVLHTVGGMPAPQVVVQWSLLEGSASLDASSSQTDAQGRARIGLVFGAGAGPVRVRAQAAGLSVDFALRAVAAQLQILSGNNQQAAPNQPLPQPLVVQLLPEAIEGVSVEWRVLDGGGQVSAPSSLTDAAGRAQIVWTLGPGAGTQRVAARLPGGTEQVFSAQALAVGGTLEIVSGGGQSLVTATASAPLVVRVVNDAGQPQAGRRLLWSATNAELSASETVSDAEGRSSQQVRLPLPGVARVRASLEGSNAVVEFVLNGGIAGAPGLSQRERDVAVALDSGCAALAALSSRTPAQQDLFSRCAEFATAAGTPGSGLGTALDQLPQDVGLGLARAGDEAVRAQIGNLDQRLRTLRGGGGNGDRVQVDLGLLGPDGRLPLSALPGLAASADAADLERELGADFDRWGAFVTGTVGRGKSRSGGAVEFDYSLGSLSAGIDYRIGSRAIVGIALGLNRDDSDFAGGRGTLDSRGSSLSAYASLWLPREIYLDASLVRGRMSFDLERRLAYALGGTRIDQRARAETDGDQLGASLALGRDFARGAFSYGTYLRGQWSRIDYDPFEEELIAGQPGFGLGLRARSPRWNSLEAILGGRASYVMSRSWGILTPSLLVEYSREFRDDPSRLELSFIHDPTSTVFGQSAAAIDRSYVNFGFGLTALWPGGRAAFLQYERRLLDDRVEHWTLSLGGRLEF
jgi:uncharacterized protein YhjY with autotransporter beta-barrel domain